MKFAIKFLTILAVPLLLAACTPYYENINDEFKLPEELKNCKVFYLRNDVGNHVTVVHCPNASSDTTSYQEGKTSHSATVITDDTNYQNNKKTSPSVIPTVGLDVLGKIEAVNCDYKTCTVTFSKESQ